MVVYVPGIDNTGLSFDGVNDHVRIPDSSSFDLTDLTYEIWIKTPNAGTSFRRLIGQQQSSTSDFFVMALEDNKLIACSRPSNLITETPTDGSSAFPNCIAVPTPLLNDNQFHHVVVTREAGVAIKYYIDGALLKTVPTTNVAGFTIAADVFIGTFNGVIQSFAGIMDEPAIYNKALTAAEVLANFQAGVSPAVCGNNVKETGEVCDGTDLAGETCVTQGFTGGTLGCAVGCLSFDTSSCTVAPVVCESNLPADPSLVSWWTGDGNTNDIIDANPGTLQNGATFATGFVTSGNGQAFSFDGVNDFVRVLDSPNLQPPRITVDAWVFPSAFASHSDIFASKDGAVPGTRSWNFQAHHSGFIPACLNKPGFSIFIGGTNFFACGATTLPLNQWSHLAATYDGSTMLIYVNGVQEGGTAPVTGILNPAPGTDLTIGALDGTSNFFNGRVDELELFDRALSATEIQAIFDADSEGKCKAVTPVCGNGIVEPPETCDDGNTVSGDGCSNICQIEVVSLPDCTVEEMKDLDGNGVVNIDDAKVIMRNIVGLPVNLGTLRNCQAINLIPS